MDSSLHFEERGKVFAALRKVVRQLDALHVEYAIVGAIALFKHGYRRYTPNVDLLIRPDDLPAIHAHLDPLGYLSLSPGGRGRRDAEHGVPIRFLLAGDFPGDAKPKPLAFPDPKTVAINIGGLRILAFQPLIDLKLAAGVSHPLRRQDLADVQGLIERLDLPLNTAEKVDPSVRGKFIELWHIIHDNPDPHKDG